jgi:hypothetical protein
MKRVMTYAIAIASVTGAVALIGASVKDLAMWQISGLDSAFMMNAGIVGALLFALGAHIDGPEEPASIISRY